MSIVNILSRTVVAFFLMVSSIDTFSQTVNDTIQIRGSVRTLAKENVEASIVAILAPTDSSIVAYALTDGQGNYAIRMVTSLNEVLVRITGFNIKQQVKRVKATTQRLDFTVKEDNMMLREVIIKAQKLWGSRDTLNYLVSAYTRDHDRTIGDVLCQLPGITINESGVIKYQGIPINHFYIENLDMLQGRYNLATQGIKAGDVATVQVMENHEHVKALQDQVQPESAAINLKLKNKAKGVWTKIADLSAGVYGDGLLWDATLQTMYFRKGEQHMLRYSGDNMGNGLDAATDHYGLTAGGGTQMVGIVGHGSSPVGNSMFGYRHGVNLNNLAKLSDDVTLNYNLNYSHRLSRGSSYARTTYILPDGTDLLLTEDIADRTHTNNADLQLVYEKNSERQFFNDTFSLAGKWDEGRGSILSSDKTVDQMLHYRSIALKNSTNWIRRTEKGGGFKWISTNSLIFNPQTLAIGGDMTARQDVNITAISTSNSFETLHDLRAHRWTLAVSGQLNATYTMLSSELDHPDVSMTAHGDMHHLHSEIGLGPVARYVNGTFRATFSLPMAINYTRIDNADIKEENTDANRVCFRLQPSLSLLWKATDNFTFSGSADYSATETPWTQLLTATLMQNYRCLSRYRAALNDSYGAKARLKVSFKDIFNGIFAHIEGGWNHSWSDIVYGSTLDAQAHTIIEAAYMPNHSENYSLTVYGRKDIDWHTMQIEISLSGTCGKNDLLRQSVLTSFSNTGYTLHGSLAFDIVSGYRIDYSATWSRHHSKSTGYAYTYSDLNQRGQLNLRIIPSRLFLNLNANHTHNGSLASSRKDYFFLGAGLRLKLSKSIELNLDGDNITNIHTFTSRYTGNMEEHYTEYYLRPWSVTLSTQISL